MSNLVPVERIETKILLIRGQKVIMDADLASLYEVRTIALNQAVRRNRKRFPDDFMFQLNAGERAELITNCDRFKNLKHSSYMPYAFTEQGVAMLSSILNSERAIQINILIMRVFTRLKDMIAAHKELAQKIKELEGRVGRHDVHIGHIIKAINKLLKPKVEEPVVEKIKKIGFLKG